MLQLKTLLLLEDAKIIVIDEGLNAPYGKYFVRGCLQQRQRQQQIRERKTDHSTIEVLSFSEPTHRCATESGVLYMENATVHDCYTIELASTDRGKTDLETVECIMNMVSPESTVVVDCLNSLMLNIGIAKSFKVLRKIAARSLQLICIYRKPFTIGNRISSSIETLGTTYVKLSACLPHSVQCVPGTITYSATVVHSKAGGSTLRQSKLLTQNIVSYEIIEERDTPQNDLMSERFTSSHDEKIKSSFRIAISDREMEQKRNTSLPYAISANSVGSKILYLPENLDDVDEEDPDDDLCF